MKNIHVLILLLLNLPSTLCTAQAYESENYNAQIRKEIIDDAIKNLPNLVEAFNLLQKQNLSHQSFHEYLTEHLNQDTELKFNFGETIEKAEDFITTKMHDQFLATMQHALSTNRTYTNIDDPLFLSIIKHKDGCMRFFIQQWVNQTDKKIDNGTFLHQAVTKNNRSLVDFLITAGANLNTQNKSGWTALYRATLYNYTEIADILIAAGADLNIPDKSGETALHCATLMDSQEIASKLIAAGANLNGKDTYGCTPLHRAAFNNKITIAGMLIHNKAHLNMQDNNGETPLFGAAKNNRMSIVQMLMSAGAHINIKNNKSYTADQRICLPKIEALFEKIRQKNDERTIAIFQKQIKKDWR